MRRRVRDVEQRLLPFRMFVNDNQIGCPEVCMRHVRQVMPAAAAISPPAIGNRDTQSAAGSDLPDRHGGVRLAAGHEASESERADRLSGVLRGAERKSTHRSPRCRPAEPRGSGS